MTPFFTESIIVALLGCIAAIAGAWLTTRVKLAEVTKASEAKLAEVRVTEKNYQLSVDKQLHDASQAIMDRLAHEVELLLPRIERLELEKRDLIVENTILKNELSLLTLRVNELESKNKELREVLEITRNLAGKS